MPTATEQPTRLADRLAGRSLLVTGATGLLGKVFVEKILRSVPGIGRLVLLVRPRSDGTSSSERLRSEIVGSSAFDRLRALLGARFDEHCAEKIRVVDGDLTREGLGLADQDRRQLTEELELIVNCAAAVTFDERLDVALELNALGPQRLLELARDCGNIPMMQVSTCYVSGRRRGEIPESLTGATECPDLDVDHTIGDMRETCRRIRRETPAGGEELHRRLVEAGMDFAHRHGWNDTYTFTKWLGEQLLACNPDPTPLVILRPAIIEGSFDEPVPGWIDGLRMADPMIMAFGRGKLQEFPGDPRVTIDIIPVDHVANAMIATLPVDAEPGPVQVYQSASSHRSPLQLSDMVCYLSEGFRQCPMIDDAGREIRAGTFALVQRDAFIRKWELRRQRALRYRRLLEQAGIAPNRRRRLSAVVSQIEQIIYFARIYAPYTHLDVRYSDDRLYDVAQSLHPDDRSEFPFAVTDLPWSDYIINRHIPGLRKYVLGGGQPLRQAVSTIEVASLEPRLGAVRESARTIFEAFSGVCAVCPDKTALQVKRGGRWTRYTYDEVLQATATVARRFAEMNLAPGDRVVICAENGPEWGITYLAAMRSGLTAVPVDPQLPGPEVLGCAKFAEARVICAGHTTWDTVEAALSEEAEADHGPLRLAHLQRDLVPPPGVSRDPGPPAVQGAGGDIASILFTSGTTVAPKAVPLTHANLLANARDLLSVHALRSDERFISVLPMYHAFEFTGGFLVPMLIGAGVTYVAQLKGPEILEAMQACRATIMLAVPRLLQVLYDGIRRTADASGLATRAYFRTAARLSEWTAGQAGRTLFKPVHRRFGGHMRTFISGGSALDPELHAALTRLGFKVYEGYGLTETGPVLTVNPPELSKPGSAGRALPGVRLQIHNANSQGIGELWARGPNVMSGYLHNPQATEEVMRDGWFRTGDLCRRDADGFYYITGRVKDMIVTEAGKNVYPDEVEVRYKDLPYVKELCVLGMPSAGGIGEAVHAVVVPDYEQAPGLDPSTVERSIREAAAQLSQDIPAHQRIQHLHFWNTELPKTTTLKAKRGEVRAMLQDGKQAAGRAPQTSGSPPDDGRVLTEAQQFVRGAIAQLTREKEALIHPDSNLLLDLGVDSLMKLQLLSEIEAHLDVKYSNEQASALARVHDLYALVGDRPVIRERSATPSRRQAVPAAATERDGRDLPAALRPARWVTRGGMAVFLRSYVRVRARGLEHIPPEGPFILAANHSSHLDAASVVTAAAGKRRIWVAGAEDYFFNSGPKSWLFGKLLDTIPFDRFSEGYEGLNRCLEKLEQGHGLLFFPEGTRSLTGEMADFKTGVALMAVASDALIIPTRIENAFHLLPKGGRLVRPGVVRVTFGRPIDPQPWRCPDDINRQYQLYRELAREVQEQVRRLKWSRRPAREGG